MKKLIHLIAISILLSPLTVNAKVDSSTEGETFNTKAECETRLLSENDKEANKSASNGYYLTCVETTCVSSYEFYKDLAPIMSNITCENNNTDPYVVAKSGFMKWDKINWSLNWTYTSTVPCDTDPEEGAPFTDQYHATVINYNCTKKKDNTEYQVVNNDITTTNNNNNTSNENTKNPETGINTYYLVLSGTVLILSIGLYVINKKNLFKKI